MENNTEFNQAQLKQKIKSMIPFHEQDIGDNDNLLEIGMDSISIMQLVNHWRSQKRDITFSSLVETPTLADWYRLLSLS